MTRTYTTVTMGGGSPRSHATPPATTGAADGDGSYRDWYFTPSNAAAIAEHHARVRDAESAVQVYEARHPGTYLLAGDDPVRVELSRLYKAVDELRDGGPTVEPSPERRHAEAVKLLPPVAAIREWGRQWKAMREAREVARISERRRAAKVCPHCGGKL